MSAANGLFVALVGLISALAGGLLQATSARQFERIKFRRQAKWDLYTSYFVILGNLTFCDTGTSEHRSALAEMAQIRARIALIAIGEIIHAVACVFTFPDLHSDEAQSAMAHALRTMRRDVGDVDCRIDERLLKALMFSSPRNFE